MKSRFLFVTAKWIRILFYICFGIVLLTGISAGVYTVVRGPIIPCVFDDGPFFGEKIREIPVGSPSQELEIFQGMRIQVFDPTKRNESPIVVLRDKDLQVLWAIRADGHSSGDVREIRFNSFKSPFVWHGLVRGQVQWTFGNEATYWFISRFGSLGGYCYSW